MAHEQFKSCIDACNACADACDHCATACLAEANPQPLARCISLDIDCAAICRLAAGYMARGSETVGVVCDACMQLCELCGKECEGHALEHCRRCAEECRRCADECRHMVTSGVS